MNERIKLLADQAGMYVDLNGNPWPKWMSAEECEVAYKKFAQLIVWECAEQSMLIGRYNTPSGITPDLAIAIAVGLKKHFGVEI